MPLSGIFLGEALSEIAANLRDMDLPLDALCVEVMDLSLLSRALYIRDTRCPA